jgi:S-DNA-T family DNA segregation ATPase FtsK/SpoIIIE
MQPHQPSDTLSPDAPLPAHASHRDVQRAALRELVSLLTESATTESEIEARHRAAVEDVEKAIVKARQDVEHRAAAKREEAEQKYQQAVAEADAKYRAGLQSLDSSTEDVRLKINRDHDSVVAGVKRRFEQAWFMSDSLLEATQNSIRDEWRKAKQAADEQSAALDGMEVKAAELVQLYGQPLAMDAVEPGKVEGDAAQAFKWHREETERHLRSLKVMPVARMFVGLRPFVAATVLLAAGGIAGQLTAAAVTGRPGEVNVQYIVGGVGIALVLVVALGFGLKVVAGRQVRREYDAFRLSVATAREAAEIQLANLKKLHEARNAEAQRKRDHEVRKAKEKFAPYLQQADETREVNLQNVQIEFSQKVSALETQRDRTRKEAGELRRQTLEEIQRKQDAELRKAQQRMEQQSQESLRWYQDSRAGVERRWYERVEQIRTPIDRAPGQPAATAVARGGDGAAGATDTQPAGWDEAYWRSWTPPKRFGSAVRFGELQVDLKRIADEHPQGSSFKLELPPPFAVPASLAVPKQASLLIQTDRAGRDEAMGTLQTVMLRLLTTLPPGRVRFTIIDPVGLGQNFAGFMHLADHDEALVGGRIWTDSEHIEARLRDLTEHMETVIQKYLRNEFQTIDDYNEQAGELSEPYRFLVISDFPVGFEGDSFRRLSSILQSGPRCGVYTLILRDMRLTLPAGVHLEELEHHGGANLVRDPEQGRFVWKDETFKQFPLKLDPPPGEELLTHLVHVVGRKAKDSKRVEVPFETIAPPEDKFWTGSSTDDLRVPIGKMGATRLQSMRLGRGVAQHALIAGKTGSGKSTLLHALVTNLAMWYSPDEVEFYLIDFKKGVEFKTYATHRLPHARAIAVESDREFGLSVLQRLDAELARRGELYRKAGVQDLAGYRKSAGAQIMPRTLLIIDEFQEFFSEDDKLAQEAGLLMDRLVRQGRAFGIHLLLGSQTIGGTSGLARSTIGQMAVRVALQTSEADSHLILGDNNSAARLLSRPGEAIYNDAGGLVEANSPFQVAWLPDDRREKFLEKVRQRADARSVRGHDAVVFEGNAPADIHKNAGLLRLLDAPEWPAPITSPVGWVGDPVAIKEPSGVAYRRQSGANLLVIGQQEDAAMAALAASMISIAAQQAPGAAKFYVLDGTPADSPLAGVFAKLKSALPHDIKLVEFRAAGDAVGEIADEVQRRLDSDPGDAPDVYLVIYGLQRYRALRKSEDDFGGFSMSTSDEPKKANPGKQFAEVLKDGPSVGVHVLAWIDTATAIDRTLDRHSMREFDNRVLFQMSAADSSNLIDSPAANKLGFYRALVFSEEQGTMEKFRPYALPDPAWLEHVRAKFAARNSRVPAAAGHASGNGNAAGSVL